MKTELSETLKKSFDNWDSAIKQNIEATKQLIDSVSKLNDQIKRMLGDIDETNSK